ncbi:sialate O-acetylesterase [Tuwongella immobilis]|uniref:Sialate O-acetylesterase domain-containing protein n=1 Tax=Tuwongella immobilis TaxID=692036 RepID=A0A6C2YIU7_9BACT|nr:sialate O-acetylesterase [Tuwongella immobilis]VIP01460.1 Sialic acid-specific 9-O-acetylesterase OS=Rhodopirellula maiorica SM1 GN=RMSM_01246 PE=4 SV=1: DUF303 [Tuwongella immobilis]VTR98472.1 Sialic acid-specific 9-O-acetylesterase OS=Rhodopirellula maiorica SM1 GN=RMSM_01246 PE=4 SV=1: DUF303 [Tuwongella immobilis]
MPRRTFLRNRLSLATLAALLMALPVSAAVKPASLFSTHMVLQQEMPVPIFGTAEPGESVTVSIHDQKKTVKTDAQGKWSVTLDPLKPSKASKPTTMTIAGSNTITIDDVLIGEVWLCSGQSNMAWTVARSRDFEAEKAAAKNPQIRMFLVTSGAAATPQTECKGSWIVCSPETVGGFTAAGYFFAKELYPQLKRPIGLINSSVGGTPVEAWTSQAAMDRTPEIKPVLERWQQSEANYNPEKAKAAFETQLKRYEELAKQGKAPANKPRLQLQPSKSPQYPAVLYNGKIAPLERYAIRGAIWYQGENNAGSPHPHLYGKQLELMISDWRARWGQGDFPFAWVQLPNFQTAAQWPILREQMLQTLKVPQTGMAIAIDVGDPKDIHPTNKQPVGSRLAYWALATVYGQKRAYSGPIPTTNRVEGDSIVVNFDHANDGLKLLDRSESGFEIAGADQVWHAAEAKVVAPNSVVIRSKAVAKPVAVRYLWANNPTATLFNGADLPATPFRTDTWDGKVGTPAPAKPAAAPAKPAKPVKPKTVPALPILPPPEKP